MANEIKVTATTGQTLTYIAYAPDGTVRTVLTGIPEILTTGYYTASDAALVAGDTVKYFSSGVDVGGSEYQPDGGTVNTVSTVTDGAKLSTQGTMETTLDAVSPQLDSMSGAGFNTNTDSLEEISDAIAAVAAADGTPRIV